LFSAKREHLDYVDAINATGERIIYDEDENARVNII